MFLVSLVKTQEFRWIRPVRYIALIRRLAASPAHPTSSADWSPPCRRGWSAYYAGSSTGPSSHDGSPCDRISRIYATAPPWGTRGMHHERLIRRQHHANHDSPADAPRRFRARTHVEGRPFPLPRIHDSVSALHRQSATVRRLLFPPPLAMAQRIGQAVPLPLLAAGRPCQHARLRVVRRLRSRRIVRRDD